jgi:propionyl-CoA carboxylase beta chain
MTSAPPSAAHSTIMPNATRRRLARALAMLKNKHVEMPSRKHDNLPV